jgi:hypothetical protein
LQGALKERFSKKRGLKVGAQAAHHIPIGAGRVSHDFTESPIKVREIIEAGLEGDIAHAAIGMQQFRTTAGYPDFINVPVERFPCFLAEKAAKGLRRHAELTGSLGLGHPGRRGLVVDPGEDLSQAAIHEHFTRGTLGIEKSFSTQGREPIQNLQPTCEPAPSGGRTFYVWKVFRQLRASRESNWIPREDWRRSLLMRRASGSSQKGAPHFSGKK